jgi:AcrR family transcriptional regulator
MKPVTGKRTHDRRDSGQRREQLVEAGARVVARDGIAAASTRRIAEEAGVPQGLVHYWFSRKEELVEEVVLAYLREFEAAVSRRTVPETGTADDTDQPRPDEVYRRLMAAFDIVRTDDRGRQIAMYELTTWALRTPGMADLARRQYAAYRDTSTRLAAFWLDDHTDDLPAPVDVVAQFLTAVFDGLSLAWLADPETTDPEQVLALLARLIRALPAHDRPLTLPTSSQGS